MKKNIGRVESISFPNLDILDISGKVDTGAFSNAIHVDGVEIIDDKLSFWIGDSSNKHIFDDYKTVVVRNSFGKKQKRYSVRTKMKLGNSTYSIYICLTKRNKMKHPVLIGRRFLYKFGFIVDVTKKNIHDRNKKV
jgi:hypothetical protein